MIQPFYASSAINRHGDYRNNVKLLKNIIIEKNTKFIPFYKGKNLFREINQDIKPVIFNNNQIHEFFPNGIRDTIFLSIIFLSIYAFIPTDSNEYKYSQIIDLNIKESCYEDKVWIGSDIAKQYPDYFRNIKDVGLIVTHFFASLLFTVANAFPA